MTHQHPAAEKRAERVRRIRDNLECGLHRAVEIERGLHVVARINHAKALGSVSDLCDAVRDIALDQYRLREIDMEKIEAKVSA